MNNIDYVSNYKFMCVLMYMDGWVYGYMYMYTYILLLVIFLLFCICYY